MLSPCPEAAPTRAPLPRAPAGLITRGVHAPRAAPDTAHCSHTRGGLLEPRGTATRKVEASRARWCAQGPPTPVQAPAHPARAQQLAQSPLPHSPPSPSLAEPPARRAPGLRPFPSHSASRAPSPPLQSPQPTEPPSPEELLPFPRAPSPHLQSPKPHRAPRPTPPPRETAGWLLEEAPREAGSGPGRTGEWPGPLST